ncbi:hypothetical protein AX15_007828 [Amanita polypyramis BW_CC]|nr:hypothetical protein AX15_007828 [Amanita polypyramis BW_CC]
MEFPNLAEMMDHRPLDQLYHCWQVAITHIEQQARTPDQLREGKRRLKQQLREFTTGEPASPCSSVSSQDNIHAVCNEPKPSFPLPFHNAPCHPYPACPPEYPFTVLWTYDDYKAQCFSSFQRPGSVPFAIRHADGKQISHKEWAAIATLVKYVEYDLLMQTNSRDLSGKLRRRSDSSYYKCYHREHWDKAIEKLETVCSILGLCAYHWKAEMVLRWALEQPGDPEDPKKVTSKPDACMDANIHKARAHLNDKAMSNSTAVKRARDLSTDDIYPNKKMVSGSLRQSLQTQSIPVAPAPLPGGVATASSSTANVSAQPSTLTRVWTNEEMKRMALVSKITQLYKADLYELVVRHQLATVHKRTLKQDLVVLATNAALADKLIADEVDKMFYEDLPQKRMSRQQVNLTQT